MAGFIITTDSTLLCSHQLGTARAVMPDPHVSINGNAIMTVQRPYLIEHCTDTNTGPCTKASWELGAQRVTASGLAVAINNGLSKVDPVGALVPQQFQTTVSAS